MTPSDALRRGADVVVAVTGLAITAPLTLLAAVAVRRDLGAGVVYRQERLGRGGHPFSLRKFRTMRPARPGRADPRHDGERITRVGSLLRATSVDELPSLVNLLRGDITLVGPRPLPTHYWPRFRNDEYERFLVRPGITGLAQVAGRNLLSWDERLALDVRYVRTRSLVGDLRLLARTVPVVVARTGVDREGGVTMTALPDDRPSDAGRVQRPGEAYAASVRSTTRS